MSTNINQVRKINNLALPEIELSHGNITLHYFPEEDSLLEIRNMGGYLSFNINYPATEKLIEDDLQLSPIIKLFEGWVIGLSNLKSLLKSLVIQDVPSKPTKIYSEFNPNDDDFMYIMEIHWSHPCIKPLFSDDLVKQFNAIKLK